MTEPLEQCPFCGGVAEADYQRGYRSLTSGKLSRAVAIYCCGCNADMILCREDYPEVDPEALMSELMGNWNRRAPIASEPKDAGSGEGQELTQADEEAALARVLAGLDLTSGEVIDVYDQMKQLGFAITRTAPSGAKP